MSHPNPGPKSHAVSDLLEQVVEAHGGLRTWREVRTVTTGSTTWGITWSLKGQSASFGDVILDVTTTDQVLRVHPFVNKGCRGRLSVTGPQANRIAVDIVRLENGLIAEHWDVVQDEATAEESKSGLPMFGDTFPTRARPEADRR